MEDLEAIPKCFIISPIGQPESEARRRSDKVPRHIIEPIVDQCGYTPIRADKIDAPEMITNQIIRLVVESDIVIADLTGHNPNVMYELVIRHSTRKPAIHVLAKGEQLPFDIGGNRTIFVDHSDLGSAADCRSELINQIKVIEKDPDAVDNPITISFDLMAMKASEGPVDHTLAAMAESIQDIQAQMRRLRVRPTRQMPQPHAERSMADYREHPPDFDESESRRSLLTIQRLIVEGNVPQETAEGMRRRMVQLASTLETTTEYDRLWEDVNAMVDQLPLEDW
ncbi:MAG TPA: hypothetical protein VMM78_03040 [Thermomicrobiales bacterium]|nr:hypothetical protein [Thermomicrobiales bacterium]